ncbi:MAG: AzlD domain-containing protein [Thaumarchaeota archaeon]|nr:AzlD domain-containing protein [Nitrososphaerota archaeon]
MIDPQTVWLAIIGSGVITFLLRFSFISLSGRMNLPASVRQGLELVPAAVLSALILPDVLGPTLSGQVPFYADARVFAGIAALLVAWRTKNVALIIGVGLASYWILQNLV